ncbi:MAG: 6,7-dimethyl-8-ribityllumazine synthase [Fibrobacter sp.]|nr:6,7-dimethyl-8-ribityllumazine synthase [Fibrobacter sp.]
MSKFIEGNLEAKGLRIAIISARFNEMVVDSLTAGAINSLQRLGASTEDVDVFKVPGAFEIPGLANKLLKQDKYHGIICLGAVIRGDTPHFDMVVNGVTSGIANLSMKADIPVIFGVLTTDTVEQAMDRSGLKSGNKGAEAAVAVVEMASLYRKVEKL